jgi:hypothetical protein
MPSPRPGFTWRCRASRGACSSGGERLMLAVATGYCNDLHREPARLHIGIDSVEVEASGDFAGLGLAATNIRYRTRVVSRYSDCPGQKKAE